ncbi:probable L-type lectin-domain containing receptor kinase S.5 [Phragmites australis]|uniref:probable L-type lectin-domain containing receptor kinase S.5 n=1 Tax=Phragmites australis TaxID=29695 RepID=UPI002D76EC5C|nr:probable L-type lectin-domain containing receptor kinase S.5 [Phragmites australis]
MANHNSICSLALLASASFAILSSTCSCLQFSYPSFDKSNKDDFSFSLGSGIADGSLQITPSSGDIANQSGRVCYTRETLKLWNNKHTHQTSFRTDFVLNISPHPQNKTGEGMAFILTNNPSLPGSSSGQWLGITNEQTDGSPLNRLVAVEFDTRKSYAEDLDGNHIGLDINSIESVAQYPLSNVSIFLSSGFDMSVSISYHGEFRPLIVEAMQLSTRGLHVAMQAWLIDLSKYLFEDIYVGFAGSTSEFTELNQIKSWKFITIDIPGSGGRYLTKMTWFLLISFFLCMVFASCVWRRSQRRRRLAYSSIEMMNDVPSM